MQTLVDRCVATTITSGVGALTLGNAPSAAYINLAEAVAQGQAANDQRIGYVILEGALDSPTAWEIGQGTIGGAGGSVTRGTRLSFNGSSYSSAPLSLGPGTKYVVFAPDAGSLAHGAFSWCGTASGTANDLTLSPAVPVPELVAGLSLQFVASADSTGAVTAAVSGLPPAAVQLDGTALSGGEIRHGKIYDLVYDGVAFQLSTSFSPSVESGRLRRVTIFGTSGTYNPPSWLRLANVRVWGGGGGGAAGYATAGSSGSGGAGGFSEKVILASSMSVAETVTVGAPGAGGFGSSLSGTAGGSTSFGAHVSATGGGGGTHTGVVNAPGGSGGIGSGGHENREGGIGLSGSGTGLFFGGDAPMGGQGGRSSGSAGAAGGGVSGRFPGGGGGSGISGGGGGGAGGTGRVSIYEYE